MRLVPASHRAGAKHLSNVRYGSSADHAYDRVLHGSDDTPFDCGAVATALVNAAWSRGLGAVINSQGIMQSPWCASTRE